MRGCGLRIEEALAVERKDFRDNGTILRVYQQATRDGNDTGPLKKRKRGEYRDIPVPTWLWEMVKGLPDGPLMPGNGDRTYQLYNTVYERFMNAAEVAGIPGSSRCIRCGTR
jgi:integrase